MPSASSSSLSAAAPADSGAPLGAHPSMVLGAYLEPLVRGRRVAVLGDARIGLAERLVERGARLVHAYDPDPARIAEALACAATARQPRPSFAVLEGDLGVRDGAFDAVLIPDLTLFPDAAEALRRARRLVSEGGVAVIVSPNPDAARALIPGEPRGPSSERRAGPDYYALYDLVSLQFRAVRMLGQAPFVGYTVADFAQDGDPEISIDTSLLSGSEEPEWFIALASEKPVRLEPFSVVEIPFADLPLQPARGAAEGTAAARAEALEVELSELRARLERAREHEEVRADARAEAATATHARIEELEAELAEGAARIKDVEVRAKEIEARAGDAHVRAERNGHRIRDLEEELRAQRDRAARLAKQLDDEKKGRTKVELELGMIRNKPEIAGAKDRIDALGAELEAARARVAELEARPAAPSRAAPDPALMLRVEELEAAVTTARREIARVSTERDGARTRIEELGRALEEQRRAAEEQQRRAAEEQQRRAAEEQRRAAAEQRRAAEEQQRRAAEEQQRRAVEEQQRRAAEEQQRRAAAEQRRAAEEQQKRAAEEQRRAAEEPQRRAAEEQRRRVAAEEQRRASAALEARIAELEGQRADLARRNDELEKQKAELVRGDAGEVLAGEIAALEAALRERGKLIVALQAELRESERVGKELVDELGHLFEASPHGEGAAGGGSAQEGPAAGESKEALRRQLDTLAHSAARYEADLHAATWRIAQLERELSEARVSVEPARVHEELEQALSAAQAELAALRRAAAREPSPEIVEQAVLLHQVAGAAP